MTSRDEERGPARRARTRTAGMAMAKAIAKASAPISSASSGVVLPASRKSAQVPSPVRSSAARSGPQRSAPGSKRPSARGDQSRLAELKVKLGDEDYMNGAILRIATVLSARLTLR